MIDYFTYWNLKQAPFQDNNDPRFYYKSSDHLEALERLHYIIESGSMNLGMLSGEVGTGKTITKMVLIDELNNNDSKNIIVNINSTSFNYTEILTEIISQAMHVDPENLPTKRYYLELRLKKFLQDEINRTNCKLYILLDEAQKISGKDLDFLKDLTNITFNFDSPIIIIFIGQPSLMKNVRKLPQVDQRIGMRYHLSHMNEVDTIKYINHRLKVSGATNEIFSLDAAKLIFSKTKGIPREINRACKIAMDIASTEEIKVIDAEIMTIVFHDLENNGNIY